MTKVSQLALRASQLFTAMMLLAILVLTAGCGGGGSSTSGTTPPPSGEVPPPSTPPAPDPVEGIATPTSVAVVTATNAQ